MASKNAPASTTTAPAPVADVQEFRTGKVVSESRRYDMQHGQQVVEGQEEYVTFAEPVSDDDAILMLDDVAAVKAYMAEVGSKAYTLASKPYRLVGGAAVASRYKAKKAVQSLR